jgi:hypothetical protein
MTLPSKTLVTRYNGNTWNELPAPLLQMDSQLSYATLNNLIYCAFRSGDDPLGNVVVQTFDGKAYSNTSWISGGTTSATPALAVYKNTLYCVYGNPADGGLHYSYLTSTGWTKDATIYLTGTTKQPDGIWASPSLAAYNGVLYILYQLYNHTGNLRCVSYDGTTWTQVGGKGNDLPVPGMSMSPTAFSWWGQLYVYYQGYDGDGDKGDGCLWYTTFDGKTWYSGAKLLTRCMSGSPAAVVGSDQKMRIFFQGFEDDGTLLGLETINSVTWDTVLNTQIKMVSETSPGVAYVPSGSETWLLINALTQVPKPVYPPSTSMSPAAAQALLTKFAPVVRLCSLEKYFPASVDWYLPRVSLDYQKKVDVSVVTEENLILQADGDVYSFLIPTGTGPSTGYTQAHEYTLDITDKETRKGIKPHPPVNPQAPFYGAVIDNPGMKSTDLLYMFFYAYNGLAGWAFNEVGTHEGDWEHVIIRLSTDQSKVVGMYCQAHASDSTYSQWYYPPPYEDQDRQFSWWETSTTRPVVYSAAESHASYVKAGDFPLHWQGFLGYDITDNGPKWNEQPNVTLVSVPATDWLQYSGRWGKTNDWLAKSPDPPAAQGWFAPRTDGPPGD